MAKTTSTEMDALHGQLARVLKDEIESFSKPIVTTDAEGKPLTVYRDKKGFAAILSVARQFLKDNEVTASAVPDSPLQNLADSLPFAGEEFNEDSPVH